MKTLNTYISVCIFALFSLSGHSKSLLDESPIVLDTLYANETKNVALFFPSPIRQGIVGSDFFVFSFNRDIPQYFGLLQAQPGKESNLLVITTDGSIYSYIIKYKAELTRVNYFVEPQQRIGQEVQNRAASAPITLKPTAAIPLSHMKAVSAQLLKRKQRLGHLTKRNYGIKLTTKNIVFNKEHLYFVFEIENKSGLDYDVDFLEVAVQSRAKGKRKSSQRIVKQPLYKHQFPKKVKKGERVRFVYVLSKYSLSNNNRVVVQLHEAQGERDLKLKIAHRFINNPN